MAERGINISRNRPKPLDMKMVQEAEMIITMGCDAQEFCPAPLLNKVIEWNLEDPKEKPIEKVRQIRDGIERRVKNLIDPVC